MAISGLLFSDIAAAVAWGRMISPFWLADGTAVWPFIRVAARGMVTVTHLATCQGQLPRGNVIHHLSGQHPWPVPEHVAIKFSMQYREADTLPVNLLKFSYIGISVHLRYLDLRGKRKKKQPSLFDDI